MTQRTLIGFARDHSGSMRHIAHAALRDYNDQLATIQAAAITTDQETYITSVTIGNGRSGTVGVEITNVPVSDVHPLAQYLADANATPMIAATFKLIDLLERSPYAADPETSFVVMVTTDGQENVNRYDGGRLALKIRELQNTDRWTFVFRVPKGGTRELAALGIRDVNVFEWDQSVKGVQTSTQANVEAFTEYYTARKSGMKSTKRFYANLQDVNVEEVKKALVDVSSEVVLFPVSSSEGGTVIRTFVESKLQGEPMVRGGAFYQLVKLEPRVQANKRIAVRNKNSGAVFAGDAARQMLALPTVGTVRLAPDALGEWDVFIQSTSVNRKLDPNTSLMYWKGVGKAFQEGPSAR